MKLRFAAFVFIFACFSFNQKEKPAQSLVESFVTQFAKTHKNWTQDYQTTFQLNQLFADTLERFYQFHKNALESLPLRLASISDSGNGRIIIAFECQNRFVDGKEIRAHVYNYQPLANLKQLAVGNYYYLHGPIKEAYVRETVGYNRTDNTCDIGIIYFDLAEIIKRSDKNH
jgi:hypothetical protein